jgi:alpha-glucoside transport system substrate-binding protein
MTIRMRRTSRTSRWARALLSVAALLVAAGPAACAGPDAGTVSVLATWTGGEESDFRNVLNAFTADTGIEVNYTGTRALSEVLASDVQEDTTPDVAVLPSIGELASYARRNALKPLDGLIDQSTAGRSRQWLELEKAGQQHRYGVAVKATLKSLIWYDTKRLPTFGTRPPQTWDQLVAVSGRLRDDGQTPWCMGMEATPASGWPGTDWIEDLLLHGYDRTDVYRQWVRGTKNWSKESGPDEVRRAWDSWGTIAAGPGMVRGGPGAAILTNFDDAAVAMSTNPPGCVLQHQASFALDRYLNLNAGVDFIPFPDANVPAGDPAGHRWEVSADLAGMFNDTPQARKLINYLASDKAQRTWLEKSKGTVFSVNRNVARSAYRNDVSRHIADILTGQATLCFDASDLMPPAMTNAFQRAVLEYLHDPSRLDVLLARLDQVRAAVPADEWLDVPCVGSQ